MSGTATPSRRQREDDSEDDVSPDEVSTPGSRSSKRQRLSPDASSHTSENDLLPDSYRTIPRATSGSQEAHAPGSIIRIKVKNFVTYTAAEFKCGPSLNMIIGPNGTGKSTLVCAICLGLGWKTSVLGRAKDIGEYVKHGQREAEIEIELKAAHNSKKGNPIIGHTIKREGNKSSWTLNGRRVQLQDIMKLMRSFHIQIDNLCQFLPQDRVVEFAAMSPVQLLEQTQKAAAPEQMTLWHSELKKLGADRKKRLADQGSAQAELTGLQSKHNAQRGDVERMNERASLLTRVQALEKCKPIVEYQFEKTKYEEMRDRQKEAEAELRDLEAEVEPSLADLNAKTAYRDRLVSCVQQQRKLVERMDGTCKNDANKVNTNKQKMEECDVEIATERDRNTATKKEMDRLKREITHLKSTLDNRPPELDTAALNEQIREISTEIRDNTARNREVDESIEEWRADATRRRGERDQLKHQMEQLKTQSGQQLSILEKVSRETAQAWKWLQKNQHLFREKVYGPAIVECTVTDKRYAAAVESMLNAGEFLSFTATNADDWRILQEHLITKMNLKDIHTRSAGQPMSHWIRPMSKEELTECGLDGFAIDYLEGPEPILSMLCDNKGLHKSAVSLQSGDDDQFERLKNSPVQTWVAGKRSYKIIRRREYGPNAVSTAVGGINNARYWTGNSIDHDAEAALNRKLREVEGDLGALEERKEEIKTRKQELKQEFDGLNAKRDALQTEKDDHQKVMSTFLTLPTKIATREEKLAVLQKSSEEYQERRRAIIARKQEICLERGKDAIQYAVRVGALRSLHAELFQAELRSIEADSEVHILTERHSDVNNTLKARKKEVQDLKTGVQNQKKIATELGKKIRKIQQEMTNEEELAVWSEYGQNPETTPETLATEIMLIKHKIELLHVGNPRAIEQYEERQRKIDKLTKSLENFEGDIEKVNDQIQIIRAQWEPELDALVSEISEAFTHNFDRIGCAGQVGVHKDDEDFKEWAIQIQVKFREHEQLSILDSHRQSGGERAVSTIFYLMALQSLARSPFRVVDEINQGMDPRNERLVHGRMVEIACSENTSQYFLITPKLLNGLKYHERMSVHTIYSGETMPKDDKVLDMRALAHRALTAKKGVAH